MYLCISSYISSRGTVAETSGFNSAALTFKSNSLTSFLDKCLILVVLLASGGGVCFSQLACESIHKSHSALWVHGH